MKSRLSVVTEYSKGRNFEEAEVKYIVAENYDEEDDEWYIDFSEGIEILPCQL